MEIILILFTGEFVFPTGGYDPLRSLQEISIHGRILDLELLRGSIF